MEEPETSRKEDNPTPSPPREKRVLNINAEEDREWAIKNNWQSYFQKEIAHDHLYCATRPKEPEEPMPKEAHPGFRNLENSAPNKVQNNETMDDVFVEQPAAHPVQPRQRLLSASGEMQTLDSGVVSPQRPILTFVRRSNSPQKLHPTGRFPAFLGSTQSRSDLSVNRACDASSSRPGDQARPFPPGAAPLLLASRGGSKHFIRSRPMRPGQNEVMPQPDRSISLPTSQVPRSLQKKIVRAMPGPSQPGLLQSPEAVLGPGEVLAVRLAPPIRTPPEQKQIPAIRTARIMRPAVLPKAVLPVSSDIQAVSLAQVAAPPQQMGEKEEVLPPHIRDVAISLQQERAQFHTFVHDLSSGDAMDRMSTMHHPLPKSALRLPSPLARHRQISTSSGASQRLIGPPGSSPTRVPGSSPVRTNLDFNNHLQVLSRREAVPPMLGMPPVRGGIKSNLSAVQMNLAKPGAKKRGRKPKQREPSTSMDEDIEEKEEGSGVRCVCGTEEEFKELGWVMCDGCSVWQHAWCVGFNLKTEKNDKYFCERCDKEKIRHRPHTAEEAAAFVRELVEQERKALPGKKNKKQNSSPQKDVEEGMKRFGKKKGGELFQPIRSMTRNAKQLIALSGTANHFTGPRAVPNSCAKMMVAQEEVYGLVAMAKGGIPAGSAAMELYGAVAVPNEIERPETFNPFIFYYDGFVDQNANLSIQQKKENQICVDARKFPQDGRFVRRCCRPNSTLRHSTDGKVPTFYIVARQNIAEREEITIPFEAGYHPASKSLCRCSGIDGTNCLLEDPNFIGPGFTEPPRPPSPPIPSPPQKKTRGRKSATTAVEVSKVKEEKSEEESAIEPQKKSPPKSPPKRGRTKSISSKKESEKEELKPEAKTSKRGRKEPVSEPIKKNAKSTEKGKIQQPPIYVVSGDRNKETREERKLRMYTEMFNKASDSREKKQNVMKRGRPAAKAKEVKDEPVETPVGRGGRAVKTEEPTSAAVEQEQKADASSQQAPKKRLLKRWEEAAKETESPAKKRKPPPEKADQEAATILATMDKSVVVSPEVHIKRDVEQLAGSLKVEDFALPKNFSQLIKTFEAKKAKEEKKMALKRAAPSSSRARRESPPKEEPTKSKVKKETSIPVTKEKEVKEQEKEGPVKEKGRRMDLQSYREYRRSNPKQPETQLTTRRQGFMPDFNSIQQGATLPDIPLTGSSKRSHPETMRSPQRTPSARVAQAAPGSLSTLRDTRQPGRNNDHNLPIGSRRKSIRLA